MSISYQVIGEGYPIVMLHGWTLDHRVMQHAMEPLFEKRSGAGYCLNAFSSP